MSKEQENIGHLLQGYALENYHPNVKLINPLVAIKLSCLYLLSPAGVVKLVDTLDLGSSASRHGGSSPSTRTFIFF